MDSFSRPFPALIRKSGFLSTLIVLPSTVSLSPLQAPYFVNLQRVACNCIAEGQGR